MKFKLKMTSVKKIPLGLIFIIFILIIAGYLRIAYPYLAEFKGDEYGVALKAIKLAAGENIPCTGIMSSRNVFMPPFFIYLMAIPFFFSKDPAIAAAFIGFLNFLAVCACYFLCRKLFNKGIAVVSVLLFAFSPWAVVLSRKIWPQDVLPLFNIGFIYCLYLVFKNQKSKAILPAVILLALLPGFHLTAVTLFALLFISMLLVLGRINWKYFILGIILVLIMYFPYLRHEYLYEKANWANQITGNKEFNFGVFAGSLKIAAYENLNYHLGLPVSVSFFGDLILTLLRFLFFIGLGSSLTGMFKKCARKDAFPYFYIHFNIEYLLIVLWYIVPVLLFCFESIESYPHYFMILYPVQFIMIALGLNEIWRMIIPNKNGYAFIIILFFFAFFAKYPFLSIIIIIGFITINSFYFMKKIKSVVILYSPYLLMLSFSCIIAYEGIFICRTFKQIKAYGGTPGDYWVAVKYQKDAADYIIKDAEEKYVKCGKPVYCDNNLLYWYLLEPEKKYKFIKFSGMENYSGNGEECAFKYKVDIDFNRSLDFNKPVGFISCKYFGPVRVVVSWINSLTAENNGRV